MSTYSIREFKARVSEILREVEEGVDVIITRRGKPCGKLTSMGNSGGGKLPLSTLRGSLSHLLPDATYEDFLDLKKIWEPRPPTSEQTEPTDAR